MGCTTGLPAVRVAEPAGLVRPAPVTRHVKQTRTRGKARRRRGSRREVSAHRVRQATMACNARDGRDAQAGQTRPVAWPAWVRGAPGGRRGIEGSRGGPARTRRLDTGQADTPVRQGPGCRWMWARAAERPAAVGVTPACSESLVAAARCVVCS